MLKKLILLYLFLAISSGYAIIPPKTGVKFPPGFNQLKKEIEKSYNQGYFAEKMSSRELLREQVRDGILPESSLVEDTVFALTLLGRYSDTAPVYTVPQFQAQLFSGPNPTGTVTQYYAEVSHNQMYFTGDCKGWFAVPDIMESYLEGNGLTVTGGPRFVFDLVKAADLTINYANYIQYYDGQGRPRIGFVAAVHTGGDAAAGAHNIWSHRWTFRMLNGNQPYQTNDIDPVSGQFVLIDGDYAVQPEMRGSSNVGGALVDIGVFAHEFGHIFGIPDLYDTDNTSEGLGNWCLMAGGAYGGNGSNADTPSHMSAWCKTKLGWITPVDILALNKDLVVTNSVNTSVAYRMWKQGNPTNFEYFLVENRQKLGFDKYLPTGGLMIYHVDESQGGNQNENHYLVDLEQGDGKRHLNLGSNRGDTGDPFPGATQNTRFDLSTTPNSKSYLPDNTFVSVRNIRIDNNNIIADFDIGTKPYVEIRDVMVQENTVQNSRVEQGETAKITFTLNNIENTASAQTKFKYTITDPGIEILVSETTTQLNAQETKDVTISAAFNVKPEFVSKMLWMHYQVESEGSLYKDSLNFVVGIPKILVVSKAEKEQLIDYYTSSLKNLGYNYEEVYLDGIAFMSSREAVIYLTGQQNDSLFWQTELNDLTAYINNGGKVFISGQNFAEHMRTAAPSFLSDQLNIAWVKNGSITTRKAYGIAGDVFGDQVSEIKINGNEGAGNEISPDVISSTGDFHLSFSYKTDIIEGAGGWNTKSSGAKIFYLGFGFESINNLESTRSRDQIMQMILGYFGVVSAVTDNPEQPVDYTLLQNYPNPFNPSTVISYVLAQQSNVTLEVYDIIGRRVASLVNSNQLAGVYNINFNSGDYNLSSGVYLYKLNTGSFTSIRKMMLLK